MATSASPLITLHFQNVRRVAGETIAGSVDLNIARAQEERIERLRIEFRGAITTHITTPNPGRPATTDREIVPLIHSDQVLWRQGSAVPAADCGIVSLAFQFKLPANLPPSFHCAAKDHGGVIAYSLEVVGERPGIFRKNRRIRRVFSVVPTASQDQLAAKESLQQGWVGAWMDIKQEKRLRQGIWGEYSHAGLTLSLPDLPSFPSAASIPYRLHIMTETKTVDRTERPENKHGKPLFPVPPTQSAKLQLKLWQMTQIRASEKTEHVKETFNLQLPPPHTRNVNAVVDEPEWVPKNNSEDRGFWRRSIHFNSTLNFPFAPTTSARTLEWNYTLHLTIPFPGLGDNDLRLEFPIHLGASAPPPPVCAPSTLRVTNAEVLPAGTLHTPDLRQSVYLFARIIP
ncbi:hypothetical protein C8R45DRAFT_1133893 [Mycena sanguinolenta]|nr:hypothetical protein C8R45DRAFT_1133893 [Mycena sanguinolenta]